MPLSATEIAQLRALFADSGTRGGAPVSLRPKLQADLVKYSTDNELDASVYSFVAADADTAEFADEWRAHADGAGVTLQADRVRLVHWARAMSAPSKAPTGVDAAGRVGALVKVLTKAGYTAPPDVLAALEKADLEFDAGAADAQSVDPRVVWYIHTGQWCGEHDEEGRKFHAWIVAQRSIASAGVTAGVRPSARCGLWL